MCDANQLPPDMLVLSISNEGLNDSDFETSDSTVCVCMCVHVCALQPDFYQLLSMQKGKYTAKEALTANCCCYCL